MAYLIGVQVAAILFGIVLAIKDAPAVNAFHEYGSTDEDQAMFHSAGFTTKVGIALLVFCSLVGSVGIYVAGAVAACCALLIWLFFDPVLNRTRRVKKPTFYLSDSNKTDNLLIGWFGRKWAGVVKSVFCVVVVAAVNIILFVDL